MQSLSLINQFFTDLSYSQSSFKAQTPIKSEGGAKPAESASKSFAAGVTVALTYSKTEVAYSEKSGGRSFSLQMMETRLSGQLQSFSKLSESPRIYQSSVPSQQSSGPSPEAVADRILGFVASRIDREAQAGASEQQLSKLFADGLSGVNQGYGEAIEEIEQRGLLTDELSAEIDAGYSLIESGFERLREKYLGNSSPASKEPVDTVAGSDPVVKTNEKAVVEEKAVIEEKAVAAEKDPTVKEVVAVDIRVATVKAGETASVQAIAEKKPRVSADSVQQPSEKSARDAVERPQRSRLAEALAFDRSQYAASDVGINVTTRDGDQVRIRVAALAAGNESWGYFGRTDGQPLGYTQNSLQLDGLNLQIDGDLDDGELKALESLLLQVEDIAASFFNGDLEKAFAAALEMDVDMSEIASYAVSMTSLRYQAVEAAYHQRQPEIDAFKPLTRLVPSYAGALANAAEFSQSRQLVNDLFTKVLQPVGQAQKPDADLFSQFSKSVVDKLFY